MKQRGIIELKNKIDSMNGIRLNKIVLVIIFVVAGLAVSFLPVENNSGMDENGIQLNSSFLDTELSVHTVFQRNMECTKKSAFQSNKEYNTTINRFCRNVLFTVTKMLS